MTSGVPGLKFKQEEAIRHLRNAGLSNLEIMMVANSFKKGLDYGSLKDNLTKLNLSTGIFHALRFRKGSQRSRYQHLPCGGSVTRASGEKVWRCGRCEYEFTETQRAFAEEYGILNTLEKADIGDEVEPIISEEM